MNHTADPRSPETPDDPRKIGKWARSYAQNRSLGVVVGMVFFVILSLAILLPSYYGGEAYRAEHWPLFWACMVFLVVAVAGVFCFSTPKWGGRLMEGIVKRLYAEEGDVQVAPSCTHRHRWIGGLMGAAFGTCITASVVLGFVYHIPNKYIQPIGAIYTVPFLVGLWLLMRPAVGPIALLWPALYALHAILILVGAPILFVTPPWDSLNVFIPVFGYSLLTGLIGHIYSRVALRRLRRAAGGNAQEEAAEDSQP